MKELLFLAVLFGANVVQAITGFAGTVLAMPPSMYLLGVDNAKTILNLMALLSGVMIAVSDFHHIRWRELGKICVFMGAGMTAGIALCDYIGTGDVFLRIYGCMITAISIKNLLIRKQYILPKALLLLILVLAGVIHGMFVSGGALLVIYAAQVLKEKEEFRSTLASVWIVLNSVMMIFQANDGGFSEQNIRLILIGIPLLALAAWVGKKLLCVVSQKAFLYLTYILLLISGLSLCF